MKTKLVPLFALLTLVALGQSSAPPANDKTKTRSALIAESEIEIKRLEQKEAKAFLERDIPTLAKLWDAKYVVNNPDNKIIAGVVPEGRPGLQKPRILFTREVEHLTVRENLVISMGSERIVPGDGEPHAGKTVHRRYTHVWQHVDGEWKLIARHANVFRVDQEANKAPEPTP